MFFRRSATIHEKVLCRSAKRHGGGGDVQGKKQNFLEVCRIPVRPFDDIVKAGQPARPKTKPANQSHLPQRRTVGDACLSRRPFGRRQEDLRSNGDRAGSGSASDTRLSDNLSKKPSRSVAIRNKAIEVLRRQPDGTWKLIVGDPNGRE
jgi:hypothetical protein